MPLHNNVECSSQGTIRSDFKSLRSAVNWAMSRKPPLLGECPFTIPVTLQPSATNQAGIGRSWPVAR